DELNDEIKHYNQSFQRLMQRKEVKQIVKGYARKLEITYNEERDDYHPHFHVLIAVIKVILIKQHNIFLGIGGLNYGNRSQKTHSSHKLMFARFVVRKKIVFLRLRNTRPKIAIIFKIKKYLKYFIKH